MDLSGCECKHEGSPCDGNCVCWCDICQDTYEQNWMKKAVDKGCCKQCGMPHSPMTLEDITELELLHFYLPCDDCREDYIQCMERAGLCGICRTRPFITGEGEIDCKCTASTSASSASAEAEPEAESATQ